MPALTVKFYGDNAWPDLKDRPVQDTTQPIEVAVLEAGMASGKPSVAIRIDIDGGSIIAQTSASLFVQAGRMIHARFPDLLD